MPDKANADRRHHIPKQWHQVRNWREYNAALRQRGSLTVWFTPEAIERWRAEGRTTPGGQWRSSDLAITTALTLRVLFRLPLRQTEGLVRSILELLQADLAVPDHATISRRGRTFSINPLHRHRRRGQAADMKGVRARTAEPGRVPEDLLR